MRLGGGCRYEALVERPIRIASSASNIGLLLILEVLREQGLHIEVSFEYVHTIELVDNMVTDDFYAPVDLVVLGIGQLGYWLGKENQNYELLMQLPSLSIDLLTEPSEMPLNNKRVLFLDDPRANSAFYFEDLVQTTGSNRSALSTEYMEPNEIASVLADNVKDHAAIMYFPYLEINKLRCQQVTSSHTETYLLARDSLAQD